jgi:hypothetical protein
MPPLPPPINGPPEKLASVLTFTNNYQFKVPEHPNPKEALVNNCGSSSANVDFSSVDFSNSGSNL